MNQDILFGGWWLVVLYQLNGAPLRQLTVFDGLDIVAPGAPAAATATGFLIPGGAAPATLGVVGFDGDEQVTGDAITVNGFPLSDAVNPASNFFNSTRSELGLPFSMKGDLPSSPAAPGA